MWINCEKIFPLKFSGGRLELPEEFAHLKLFRMPEITGKAIEVDRSKERLKIAGDNEIFLGWTE
ncbi:MAG: hypothetical protein ACRD5H_00915 [Nitrososphaerales archaeon]